ncbi:MAG: hybrid sensor histidine kinase/response regulator [Solirubrobacteraceae bacterium]
MSGSRMARNDTDPQFRRAGSLAALTVALLGLIGLAGWVFGVRRLASFDPSLGQMKANTAICLVALGAAAGLHALRRGRWPAAVMAVFACAVGVATFVEYATGARLGIDTLLFADPTPVHSAAAPGRMGAETAVGFALAGAAIAGWTVRARHVLWIEAGGVVLAVVALLALIGYAFDAPHVSSGFIGEDLAPVSLQTGVAFLLCSASLLLAHPHSGVVPLLRSRGAGGVLTRLLLLPAVALPVALGVLELIGDRRNLYPTAEGVALYATALIVLFGWLVWQSARTLDRYDETLRIDEQRWRAIFDTERIGVVIRDPDGQLLECNQRYAEIMGSTPGELAGTYPADIMSTEQAALAMATYPEAWERPRAGVDVERTLTLRDGREIRIRVTVFAVTDPDGRPRYQVLLVDDLTERRRMEEELAHTRRIESIGRLAGGVAHELNNKLAVILGFNDLIAQDLGPAHPVQESLREVRAAAEHSAALTHDLLSFGRQQLLDRRPLNVSEICASLVRILRPAVGQQIDLAVEDESGDALVLGDRAQIEQVLVNLALNARDAMPDGGRLTIRTSVTPSAGGAEAGPRRVLISVTDTGVGMDEEVRDRIFEPFFTTKEFGQGAGLGLATALGIVVQSGGTINVDSRPGHGTTVAVDLPEVGADGAVGMAPGATAASTPSETAAARQCVLVVEDEPQVRRLVGLLLEDAGHRVLSVADGSEALDALHRESAIDLLLTDMVLPDIHGGELARRARALRPELRIIYMSGYESRADTQDGAPPADGVLAKPFTEEQLTSAVQEALARR